MEIKIEDDYPPSLNRPRINQGNKTSEMATFIPKGTIILMGLYDGTPIDIQTTKEKICLEKTKKKNSYEKYFNSINSFISSRMCR